MYDQTTWRAVGRTTELVELPLVVDRRGDRDLRQQVAEQLRQAIRAGSFAPEARMPSSRALADHLGVSRATVVAALAELDGEGWVESRHGSGTYVTAGIPAGQLEPTIDPHGPRVAAAVEATAGVGSSSTWNRAGRTRRGWSTRPGGGPGGRHPRNG